MLDVVLFPAVKDFAWFHAICFATAYALVRPFSFDDFGFDGLPFCLPAANSPVPFLLSTTVTRPI
jgi:hypothetical protein